MFYLDFLRRLHEVLEPETYFEIGVRRGDSLALARQQAVGVDPAYRLKVEIPEQAVLFRETSDEYFDRRYPLKPFGGQPIDLAFIDGMHLAEFALRDFVGVERLSRWTSVAVFDDIFPRDAEMAARDRRTHIWTGDVYKLLGVLARHRPDLTCLRVDTQPTGLLLVLGLDPGSHVLMDRYDRILRDGVVARDPQDVPADVLEREGALDPERVLTAGLWPWLAGQRAAGTTRRAGVRDLRGAVRRDLGAVSPGRRRRVLPVSA
jgi:hypothetical protein